MISIPLAKYLAKPLCKSTSPVSNLDIICVNCLSTNPNEHEKIFRFNNSLIVSSIVASSICCPLRYFVRCSKLLLFIFFSFFSFFFNICFFFFFFFSFFVFFFIFFFFLFILFICILFYVYSLICWFWASHFGLHILGFRKSASQIILVFFSISCFKTH